MGDTAGSGCGPLMRRRDRAAIITGLEYTRQTGGRRVDEHPTGTGSSVGGGARCGLAIRAATRLRISPASK